MAGVVAALVAHDHRDLLGQEVGRLALALVAPLEPDDDCRRHQQRLPEMKRPRAWGPGSLRIHVSRVGAPPFRRPEDSWWLGRLTGRPTPRSRAIGLSSNAGGPAAPGDRASITRGGRLDRPASAPHHTGTHPFALPQCRCRMT